MKVSQTELSGVLVIEPQVYGDERGWFLEVWHESRYGEAGLPTRFVQDNASWSRHGVLRGLHFQHPRGQGKLVYVLVGEVFDVAVDVRVDSPTFGRWTGLTLSAENRRQLYIPPGFAHGFCVTGENALFATNAATFTPRRWSTQYVGTIARLASPGRLKVRSCQRRTARDHRSKTFRADTCPHERG